MVKKIILLERRRKIRTPFSWIDQRIFQENYIRLCNSKSLGLYLFLILVSDQEGLSYYSDESICKRLSINLKELFDLRMNLIQADLIAYQRPIYQVLSVRTEKEVLLFQKRTPREDVISVKDILKEIGREL